MYATSELVVPRSMPMMRSFAIRLAFQHLVDFAQQVAQM